MTVSKARRRVAALEAKGIRGSAAIGGAIGFPRRFSGCLSSARLAVAARSPFRSSIFTGSAAIMKEEASSAAGNTSHVFSGGQCHTVIQSHIGGRY